MSDQAGTTDDLEAGDETYADYVDRMTAAGADPLPQDEWEAEAGEEPAPVTAPLPTAFTPSGDPVTISTMEGTQIDPRDGVRKPVGQIKRDPAPVIPLTPTGQEGVDVFLDQRVTQIGADGRRHPIDGDPAPHPDTPYGG